MRWERPKNCYYRGCGQCAWGKLNTKPTKGILVIGSLDHSRADCVHWTSPFPNVEEYDTVILDMTSLSQSSFDYIASNEADKLKALRSEIYTLFDTGRSVYCIFTERLLPTANVPMAKATRPTSHDWMFFDLTLKKIKPGESLAEVDPHLERYFQDLSQWQFEVIPEASRDYGADAVAKNRSGKWVAAKVYSEASVYLLPPLDQYSQKEQVDLLIDIILGKKKAAEYGWREQIKVPGLSEIQKEINGHLEEIGKINKEVEDDKKRFFDRESYRDLFSVSDELQVKAVRRVLLDLGIDSNPTKPGFVVDLLGREVAVEVTSNKNKIAADNNSLTQVSRFIQTERKTEKVILVANTYSRQPINERSAKEDFTHQAAEFLRKLDVCYLTAYCLYLLWIRVQEENLSTERAKELLLKTSNEITEEMVSTRTS